VSDSGDSSFIFKQFKVDITKYPTIPSLAFAIFRSKYMKEKEIGIIPTTSKIYKAIREGYTGGSTDMFIPQLLDSRNKIYAYDVNALYPSVMINNAYPIGSATYVEIGEHVQQLRKESELFGFFYAEIVAPDSLMYPILQIHYNNRTVSPVGKFNGWFFSEELKNALDFGYKIKIIKGFSFDPKEGYIFKNWVEDLYKMRLEYPKTDPMNLIAKLLLNSLYGRFGMGELSGYSEVITNKEFKKFTSEDLVDVLNVIELGDNILINYKDFPSLEDELGQSDFLTNVNIAIAVAVTS
jgi:hypothetical protein